jgi:hypothetical protein
MFVALFCLLPSASVYAQDGAQTVENAQKFLSIVLPGNGYRKGGLDAGLRAGLQGMRDAGGRSVGGEIQGTAKIVDAAPVAHCKSKLLSDYSDVKMKFWGRSGSGPMEYRTISAHEFGFPKDSGTVARHGIPDGFPWSDVKSVRSNGGNVYMMIAGNQDESTIYLHSEDLAKRVAYAIEFLRTSCDAAAGTGF